MHEAWWSLPHALHLADPRSGGAFACDSLGARKESADDLASRVVLHGNSTTRSPEPIIVADVTRSVARCCRGVWVGERMAAHEVAPVEMAAAARRVEVAASTVAATLAGVAEAAVVAARAAEAMARPGCTVVGAEVVADKLEAGAQVVDQVEEAATVAAATLAGVAEAAVVAATLAGVAEAAVVAATLAGVGEAAVVAARAAEAMVRPGCTVVGAVAAGAEGSLAVGHWEVAVKAEAVAAVVAWVGVAREAEEPAQEEMAVVSMVEGKGVEPAAAQRVAVTVEAVKEVSWWGRRRRRETAAEASGVVGRAVVELVEAVTDSAGDLKAVVVKGVAVREAALWAAEVEARAGAATAMAVQVEVEMAGQVVKEVERAEPAAAGCRWPSLLQTACCAHLGLDHFLYMSPQSSSRRSQSTAGKNSCTARLA